MSEESHGKHTPTSRSTTHHRTPTTSEHPTTTRLDKHQPATTTNTTYAAHLTIIPCQSATHITTTHTPNERNTPSPLRPQQTHPFLLGPIPAHPPILTKHPHFQPHDLSTSSTTTDTH
ncbi:hypothetical protein WMY93_030689 [Mugilogobius chulae]|uniref:Uncharacterized protein n=1 Tax=Mugilogobius chulae TaxID=88201 RepID=A0AAW0MJV4_9GOBI